MSIFSVNKDEVLLAQLQDTGVAGATLTVKAYGKHCFFELKSPHAVMTILNGNIEDVINLRRGLRKFEKLHAEISKTESIRPVSRTQADIQLQQAADRKKQSKKPSRGNKKTKQKD